MASSRPTWLFASIRNRYFAVIIGLALIGAATYTLVESPQGGPIACVLVEFRSYYFEEAPGFSLPDLSLQAPLKSRKYPSRGKACLILLRPEDVYSLFLCKAVLALRHPSIADFEGVPLVAYLVLQQNYNKTLSENSVSELRRSLHAQQDVTVDLVDEHMIFEGMPAKASIRKFQVAINFNKASDVEEILRIVLQERPDTLAVYFGYPGVTYGDPHEVP